MSRGKRVGRYDLVQLLGEGGMGTVWLAHPYDAPDKLYAVKTVSPEYAADPHVCAMFVKEARLAAAIDHPNVVRLYDVGLHEGVPFFVMERIDGFALRNVARTVAMTGQRVPPSVALRIASDLCGGLHAAHELCSEGGQHLALVHRDVSPHNVLVTREGVAKLIDFGVAKARDFATGSDQSGCGGIKGKVRYMAPEQALEERIDRRADLFSVGALTYQLLTGRAPFEGPNELAIINALLSAAPVFVPGDLPEPVQWILRRALARRPENRFNDAEEMQEAIELALAELGQPDKHSDVASCLAWFDPRDESDAFTSTRHAALPSVERSANASTYVQPPGASHPPALAFAVPHARESSFADDPIASIPRAGMQAANTGSWRFALAFAGFVAALGIASALLLTDSPPGERHVTVIEGNTATEHSPLTAALVEPNAATIMPIIDLGDLDEHVFAPTAKRSPRAAPPRRTPRAPVTTATGSTSK